MYKDFLTKNYYKTNHKIRVLWHIIRRILGGAIDGSSNYSNLLERISQLEAKLISIHKRLKQYLPGDKETKYLYYDDFSVEDEEEAQNLPDLTLETIKTTDHTHYISFELAVKNIGKALAGQNTLSFSVNGEPEFDVTITVPSLEINERKVIYTSFPYYSSGSAVNYNAKAIVDVNDVIKESDETNNTASITFSAKQTHEEGDPPSAGHGYLFYHIHNPEGIEINSITDVGSTSASLTYIKLPSGSPTGTVYGAHNEATHLSYFGGLGSRLELPIGTYQLTANFNGMSHTQNVIIEDGKSQTTTFVFNRTLANDYIRDSRTHNHYFEDDGVSLFHKSNFDYFFNDEPYGLFRGYYRYNHWKFEGSFGQTLNNSSINISMSGKAQVSNPSDPYNGELRMGAHSYPHIGSSYIDWDLNVNIPAQIFDYWYCQHGNANNYIQMKYGGGAKVVCQYNLTGYHLETISATSLISSFEVTNGDNNNFIAEVGDGLVSWNSSGSIDDFNISSVPFDLDGNGVKG